MNKLTLDSFMLSEHHLKKPVNNSSANDPNSQAQTIFTDSEDDFDFEMFIKGDPEEGVSHRGLGRRDGHNSNGAKSIDIDRIEGQLESLDSSTRVILGPVYKVNGEPMARRKKIDTGIDDSARSRALIGVRNLNFTKISLSHLTPNRDLKNYCDLLQGNMNSRFLANFEDEFTVQLGKRRSHIVLNLIRNLKIRTERMIHIILREQANKTKKK